MNGASSFYETAGANELFAPPQDLAPVQSAAMLRTIMMNAKRYMPMVSPIARCIAQMHINQIPRVLRFQIKMG